MPPKAPDMRNKQEFTGSHIGQHMLSLVQFDSDRLDSFASYWSREGGQSKVHASGEAKVMCMGKLW